MVESEKERKRTRADPQNTVSLLLSSVLGHLIGSEIIVRPVQSDETRSLRGQEVSEGSRVPERPSRISDRVANRINAASRDPRSRLPARLCSYVSAIEPRGLVKVNVC